ncbi:MAG: hypothetical protein OCD03_11205 [Hyphomicrobiales bacterium]
MNNNEYINFEEIENEQTEFSLNIMNMFCNKHNNNMKILNKFYENEIEASEANIHKHLFAITVNYKNSTNHMGSYSNRHVMKINKYFQKFYNCMASDLVKGNRSRQNHLLPFCRMFIDGEGTKRGGYYGNDRINSNTHHHGTILIHPTQLLQFNKMILNGKLDSWIINSKTVSSVDIQPLETDSDALKWLHYSMKLPAQLRKQKNIDAEIEFAYPYTKKGQMLEFLAD